MRLANVAWDEVDATTIRRCWRKAGILPDLNSSSSKPSVSVPISSLINTTPKPINNDENPVAGVAEELVKDALDRLEETGTLQSSTE